MGLRIGDLEADGRVVLGPMSGFTSRSYRDFMKPFGVAVSITEMTSDAAVVHGLGRSIGYVEFGPSPLTGLQLFGHDPGLMAEAARRAVSINPNIDFFDINMSCPVGKVVRTGAGSALMADPGRCGALVRSISRATGLPVTVKIRLGRTMDDVNFREVIEETCSAGASAVSLHVRTAKEGYAGEPHYEMVEGLQREMSVPLVISGNIYTLDDAVNAIGVTGAEGVMVARGGVGDPFLITQIDRYLRTGERLPDPTVSQQIDWCLSLMDMVFEEKGDEVGIRKMRCFAPRFIIGCRGCREYRRMLASEPRSRQEMTDLLEEVRSRKGGQVIRKNRCAEDVDVASSADSMSS